MREQAREHWKQRALSAIKAEMHAPPGTLKHNDFCPLECGNAKVVELHRLGASPAGVLSADVMR
jgi:hypothetical protein